ncbi:MAG: trypsin-like peptidase domain-containing protein [Myxococcales bacterium]|nr:trypsin-like peptidase domain-containing protein [Myxococcales bacterium]
MTLSFPTPSMRRELGPLLRSVVKVTTVSDAPDYDQPWQSQGPTSSCGSGAIIETRRGPRILTNAHCVANHVFIEVRRFGLARSYEAEVEGLGHECDLALLRVDDPSFFEGTTPIVIGDLPSLSDRVRVCGYPIGGERLSVAEGIVSRIDLVSYEQSNRKLLAVQIDAAINSGNSGGPVIDDGALVGIAFQALDDADGVGYAIATPVVRHFLEDVDNGVYEGFPSLGAATQKLEGPAHRRSLGLPATVEHGLGGVLVTGVAHGGSGEEILRPGDVLLAIDGVDIGADGVVEIESGLTTDFSYLVSQRHVGDTLSVEIWRAGQRLHGVMELRPPPYLVAEDRYDMRPSYYLYGGLLFVPLTRDYLKTWGESWWHNAPHRLVDLYERGLRTSERQEVVVLQKVLADRLNVGYHDLESAVMTHVGDRPIRSLSDFVRLVETDTTPFVRLRDMDGAEIVLDRAEVEARHDVILRKFGVPRDRSLDLVRAKTLEPRPPAIELRATSA